MDIFSLIPDWLVKGVMDNMVSFLSEQARKYVSEKFAQKIDNLSSQAVLQRSIKNAIQQGGERFKQEYTAVDEDLVEAISSAPNFWQSKKVQKALSSILQRPGTWQIENQEIVLEQFEDVLPERINRTRVNKAVSKLLGYIVEELWSMPGTKEIREVYSLQFQRISAESARELVEVNRKAIEENKELRVEIRQLLLALVSAVGSNMVTASSTQTLQISRPRPYTNLPRPDFTTFIGRVEELSWIRQHLSPTDRAWQIAITGIGGVGKSALALAIGHEFYKKYSELSEYERFENIIWVSAKEEILTISGPQQAFLPETTLRNLEDLYG